MRVKHTFLLPVLLLFAGVMAIVGSLLMQEWQIQQDAQEYEQLVLAVKATAAPAVETVQIAEVSIHTAFPDKTDELPATVHPTHTATVPTHVPLTTVCPTVSLQPPSEAQPAQEASAERSSGSTVIDHTALEAANSDYTAWLHIPGTKLDYPVVRTDDVDHYLTHSFSGKESICGTLFSLNRTDYQTPSRNIAIFGHHMRRSRSQTMFQPLHNYKDSCYYHKHSTIQLDSLYRSDTYTIFAVLNMCESDWDASTADFSTDEAFLVFVKRAKELSFYDTGVAVSADDHILTLITCDRDYHSTEGRLIVMAVRQ